MYLKYGDVSNFAINFKIKYQINNLVLRFSDLDIVTFYLRNKSNLFLMFQIRLRIYFMSVHGQQQSFLCRYI